jgi:hypothetical protein
MNEHLTSLAALQQYLDSLYKGDPKRDMYYGHLVNALRDVHSLTTALQRIQAEQEGN